MDTIINLQSQNLDLFYDRAPKKPYCSDDLDFGLSIRSKESAFRRAYIQHNSVAMVNALVFDIDRNYLEEGTCPAPTFKTTNRENGHAHLVYLLESPVCKSNCAHLKPLRYLSAIESGYTALLDADRGYTGLITKNPLSAVWDVQQMNDTFSLGYLAEFITLEKEPRKAEVIGLGRNCSLFDSVRKFAYKEIRGRAWTFEQFEQVVLFQAEHLNSFITPLPSNEVKSIAKSVARWVYRNMSQATFADFVERTHTPEIQSKRKNGHRKVNINQLEMDLQNL